MWGKKHRDGESKNRNDDIYFLTLPTPASYFVFKKKKILSVQFVHLRACAEFVSMIWTVQIVNLEE